MALLLSYPRNWRWALKSFFSSITIFVLIAMMYRSTLWPSVAPILLLTLQPMPAVADGSLADIKHVVLFMQENRAFDHYFGTMAGVRGFTDPNVQVNGDVPVWYQEVNASFSNATDTLLPWHLNYLGGTWLNATQCMVAGSNGWEENHEALNGGLNNHWVLGNTPWSWGCYKQSDLPVHFAIAEGWTVGDMYQESVIASTNPNRVSWVSGSINAPGSPQSPDEGGMTIDNNETPGCEGPNLNCYPLKWKTTPEIYSEAGVSWQVYQDTDHFDDNPLAWFKQYQDAKNGTALSDQGMAYIGLDKFYADAAAGTLPMISYIIGPTELSEHPPYSPNDGAWLQQQVVNAVTQSPLYSKTALFISYDETGGWGDHVTPYHSPEGTPAEWIADPYTDLGTVYTGPGFRLPFYIVSPWTRGGHVFTERADHISQIKFLERWLGALGYDNITTGEIPAWRREHMSDLVAAFDFSAPDYSVPEIPEAETPHRNAKGLYDGSSYCQAMYAETRPPVPYGEQTVDEALRVEKGFKWVRGNVTEGRFLVFELEGKAVANVNGSIGWGEASPAHDAKEHRWVVHYSGAPGNENDKFTMSSAVDGSVLGEEGNLVTDAQSAATVSIAYVGNGEGHSAVMPGLRELSRVTIYSVTYND